MKVQPRKPATAPKKKRGGRPSVTRPAPRPGNNNNNNSSKKKAPTGNTKGGGQMNIMQMKNGLAQVRRQYGVSSQEYKDAIKAYGRSK